VASQSDLLRQAEMLFGLAKHAADPELAASLVQRAADLKEEADLLIDFPPLLSRALLAIEESRTLREQRRELRDQQLQARDKLRWATLKSASLRIEIKAFWQNK
jgi:hypothetical protein